MGLYINFKYQKCNEGHQYGSKNANEKATSRNFLTTMLETPFEAMNVLFRSYIVPLSFPYNSHDNSATYPTLDLSISHPKSFSVETEYNPMFPISEIFVVVLMLDVITYTAERLTIL